MAQFQEKLEFINKNTAIMMNRVNAENAVFIDLPVTSSTYYHINSQHSTMDKGLQNINSLEGHNSPIRFNRIENFPLYGIDMQEVSINEEEHGLDTNIEGQLVIQPNTIHPFPDDYFCIDYLNKKFLFRITKVDYNTMVDKYFRCEWELHYVSDEMYLNIEEQVIGRYHCIFDNIGSVNKSIVRDDDFALLTQIRTLQYAFRSEYIEKFRNKAYNAYMYYRSEDKYLYDPMINCFCNKEKVFEIDQYNTPDCYLVYEEKRVFHTQAYENSIFDRVSHRDLTDMNDVGCYYDMETVFGVGSIFDYYKDFRVKYVMAYSLPIGPFGNTLDEYISRDFITALDIKNNGRLSDPYELFVFHYMVDPILTLKDKLKLLNTRRVKTTLHNYIFIPLIMYCLRQLYNEIVCDTQVMDEHLLSTYNMKGMTKL